MNIFIYGNDSFKGKIHTILGKANIKFKVGGDIKNIDNIDELEESIKKDPTDIFLIDQNKIVVDSLVTKIFKVLVPKDGIKKTFLDK